MKDYTDNTLIKEEVSHEGPYALVSLMRTILMYILVCLHRITQYTIHQYILRNMPFILRPLVHSRQHPLL